MAQAPQNPYDGLQGVSAAWSSARRWLTVTLPEQWAALQEIIDYVGGLGGPVVPAPYTGPTLGGASQWGIGAYAQFLYPGIDDYAVLFHRTDWVRVWNNGGAVTIGSGPTWDGHPDLDTITAVSYDFDVMLGLQFVTVWPADTGPVQRPGELKWEPGRAVIW